MLKARTTLVKRQAKTRVTNIPVTFTGCKALDLAPCHVRKAEQKEKSKSIR